MYPWLSTHQDPSCRILEGIAKAKGLHPLRPNVSHAVGATCNSLVRATERSSWGIARMRRCVKATTWVTTSRQHFCSRLQRAGRPASEPWCNCAWAMVTAKLPTNTRPWDSQVLVCQHIWHHSPDYYLHLTTCHSTCPLHPQTHIALVRRHWAPVPGGIWVESAPMCMCPRQRECTPTGEL